MFVGGVGGGNSDIFLYIRHGSFWGFKILDLNIIGGFRKIQIFDRSGMKILWMFLGASIAKLGLFMGANSVHLLKVNVQNGNIFWWWGLLKFHIFWRYA